MSDKFITRSIEVVLRQAVREFPALILTGPRQSGKTTLLNHLFGKKFKYLSLEPPDVRATAISDPRGLLDSYDSPVIFDEVQYAPGLLPYIKERIDRNRTKSGQFILTGSQNLLLSEHVSESLAGRAAVLKLLPLSEREIQGDPQRKLPWQHKTKQLPAKQSKQKLWEGFLRGGYPELNAHPKRNIALWHSSYVQTYLERDVRTLRQVGDLTQFQNFLRLLAARSGQLLNLTDIANNLGISVNTSKEWLSVLEATFQVIILRPYFGNTSKRIVKTPKVYFTDVGTLCYLTGLRDPEHAASGPLGGAIFETAVLSEIYKSILSTGDDPQIYFWRTSYGAEVDIIVESAGKLIPIEVKLSSTPTPSMTNNIKTFQNEYGAKVKPGYLIHPGATDFPLSPAASSLPFSCL